MAATVTGTPAAVATTSITLPAHAAGDILLIWAYKDGATTIPTVPSAGGTVPTWNTIDGPTGANLCSAVCCWALATATNHTSGTWTAATGMCAINFRGAATAAPIGAHAQSGSAVASQAVAPVITPNATDGSSAFVHFFGHRNVTAWSAAPGGYTQRAQVATETCCDTKDVTTSDGAVTQACTTSASGGYRGQSVEILAAPASIPGAVMAPYLAV